MPIFFKGCGYCGSRGELHQNNEFYLFCPEKEDLTNENFEFSEGVDYDLSPRVKKVRDEGNCRNFSESSIPQRKYRIEGNELVNLDTGERIPTPLALTERIEQ